MRRKLSSSAEEDNGLPEHPHAEYSNERRSFTSASDAWSAQEKSQHLAENSVLSVTLQSEEKMLENGGRHFSRLRSPWVISLPTILTTVLALAILLSITQSFTARQLDTKGCDMYYTRSMFFHFADFDTEHTRFASKYSLHLYREIGFDEDPKVKGVPVLFIPGNAGSYRQARSLASETVQQYYNHIQQNKDALKAGAMSIDFFSVDFNEDFTAFHGQTLLDQAEYLNDAVAYILSLYHDTRRSLRDPSLPDPSSVILIGHSMGGLAARTMLTMPNYQSNSINTIITISAPHARAPVSVDADLVHTYNKINDYWRQAYLQKWASDNPLWHVTLISIAGGSLDTVVPSDYASLSSLVPSADHIQTTWCLQLVRPIVKSIFDALDSHRPSQVKPRAERMRIFKKWFLTGMEKTVEKSVSRKEPSTLLTLEDHSNSVIPAGEALVLRNLGQRRKPLARLLPIPPQGTPGHKKFTFLSNQPIKEDVIENSLEVLLCSVFPVQAGHTAALFSMNIDLAEETTGSIRLACKNAAADVVPLPASTRTSVHAYDKVPYFSYLEYNLGDLGEYQFVAVVDRVNKPTSSWAIAQFDDENESILNLRSSLQHLLIFGMHIRLPADRPLVTEIRVPALHSSLLAFRLSLGKQTCEDDLELFTPLLRQYLAEPHESRFFVNVKEANISFHGIAPFMPPPLNNYAMDNGVALQFWTDPTCNSSINVSLKVDVAGSLGKLVMRYRTVFAAFPLLVVAMVLRKQFKLYDETGIFLTFSEAMDICLQSSLPILLLALTVLASSSTMMSSGSRQTSFSLFGRGGNSTASAIDFTTNDLLLGSQDSIFWFLIPLCGLLSTGVCVLLHYAALIITYTFYITCALLPAKESVTKAVDPRRGPTTAFGAASPRRRIITAIILLFLVSTIIPYQFAYLVACIIQLATCIRSIRVANETQSEAHYNLYNYVHSVLVLMLCVLPINIPVLVVWVHNLAVHWLTPFSSHHNVLSVLPFILLVETLTCGKMIPRVTSRGEKNFRLRYITNALFSFLAVYAAVYGVSYAYRLHHLVNLVSAWLVALHFSGSGFSLAGFGRMLEGKSGMGDFKKRP
ncbi:MAG: hypothetical protein Q9167_000122 [Letrouitia subvulpina]